MDFGKQKNNQKQQLNVNEDDQYVVEMKRRLLIKKQKGVIGEEVLGAFYAKDEQDIDNIGQFRLEQSLNFWGLVFFTALTSKLIYPSSVRFVKKYCKLEGFLNVHMGILPFIFMANGVVLGVYQASWHIYWFNKSVKQFKSNIQ